MSNIELFPAAELAVGQIRRFDGNPRRPIAIYNVEGHFYATDDYCTHGKASLAEGDLEGFEVICPFHAGAFDVRTGEATRSPCGRALNVHTVTEQDGVLYLSKADA